MCAQAPGLIVRHHDFENFPQGTTPHTTAPLDYLILALSILLKALTGHAIDLAGALISPSLALIGGWFLWWWSLRMKFRYRWVMLILYAISSILVHGTELGRPDHQSLSMLLVAIAICAECSLCSEPASGWAVLSGIMWGLAIWVSAYEPLVLFVLVIAMSALQNRQALLAKYRRAGWICFGSVIAIALLIEQRIPSISIFHSNEILKNWERTIGELAHVSPINPLWFCWAGYLIAITPLLIWLGLGKEKIGAKSGSALPVIVVLLVATYGLTIWQARWSYFFMLIFAVALPSCLSQSNRAFRFGSLLGCRYFQFCVSGTRGFGRTKLNRPAESSNAANRSSCAIWLSIYNRRRSARFWRHGGFLPRLLIGRGNCRGWKLAREPVWH
jgi:hypothetical protein